MTLVACLLLYASYFALLGIASNVVMIPSLHCHTYVLIKGIIACLCEFVLATIFLYTLENIIAGSLVVETPPKRQTWRFPDIFKVNLEVS